MYKEFKPHTLLASYIDAFWFVNNTSQPAAHDTLLPDGCADIIINIGSELTTDKGQTVIKNGNAYLAGTMTEYKEINHPPDAQLIGIRFKPGAFSYFYPSSFLQGLTNRTIEFDKEIVPEIHELNHDLPTMLNQFFIDRLSKPNNPILAIIAHIYALRGQVKVSEVAKKNFITSRKLERDFKLHMDISPKEFIGFVRYQFALEKIKAERNKKSLLDIAFESGYYDHAHLSREIIKYTGQRPSEF